MSEYYIDAAYCYRRSSVVCRSVTIVSPAKTAEPIEIPFGVWTRLGLGNHVLDGGPDSPWEGAILCGGDAVFCQMTLTRVAPHVAAVRLRSDARICVAV